MTAQTNIRKAIAANVDSLSQGSADRFAHLAEQLSNRDICVDSLLSRLSGFSLAVPSWGFGTGGTRFGRFPIAGEPRTIEEKMHDAATVHALTGCAPRVALHIPWDKPDDPKALKKHAADLGLGFDAMNSNTFEDQPGQAHSYKFGSLCHTSPEVRRQAIEHNIECIEIGKSLGSKTLSVWVGDGGSFPGQQNLRRALQRTIESMQDIYKALPDDWRLFTEYKPFEPAFYSTVNNDWGTCLMIATALGDKAFCLVDLGHHLPNCNIEQVVARLVSVNKLGGFHFNDSKYADDDLSTGSLKPYQLFLIFCELVEAAGDSSLKNFNPAYMLDQAHCLKDPIEDMIGSIEQVQIAHAKALLVDRVALHEYQENNDVVMAERTLKQAYETDVRPLLEEVRRRKQAAIDPIQAYRDSGYRASCAASRGSDTKTGSAFA